MAGTGGMKSGAIGWASGHGRPGDRAWRNLLRCLMDREKLAELIEAGLLLLDRPELDRFAQLPDPLMLREDQVDPITSGLRTGSSVLAPQRQAFPAPRRECAGSSVSGASVRRTADRAVADGRRQR